MTIRYAISILKEMQKWRRGEEPYDGITSETQKGMPYTPREFGEAIDVAIERMENEVDWNVNDDAAWDIYNTINDWKNGKYGLVPLNDVLNGKCNEQVEQ